MMAKNQPNRKWLASVLEKHPRHRATASRSGGHSMKKTMRTREGRRPSTRPFAASGTSCHQRSHGHSSASLVRFAAPDIAVSGTMKRMVKATSAHRAAAALARRSHQRSRGPDRSSSRGNGAANACHSAFIASSAPEKSAAATAVLK